MTRSTYQRITAADRELIFRYLRHHHVPFTRHDTIPVLASAVASVIGKRFGRGGYEGKMRFLHRFCADQASAEAKVITPPRSPNEFRPLKVTAEMRASLERVRELYAADMDHLGA